MIATGLKPPVPYFGGKSRLAAWIVGLMGPHRVYVEPFAGSAAVLLAKPRSPHEVLNDLDGNVVTFFRALRDDPGGLELACTLSPYSREEYALADLTDRTLPDLERARRWWIRTSQSFGKTSASSGWQTSIQRASAGARTSANRLGRFADVAERLQGVTIEHRDALTVVREYSCPDGIVYADPPYLADTRSALKKRPAGDYEQEFATLEQHHELAAALIASPAHVLLSGYGSTAYAELYAGWWRVERNVSRHSGNARGSAQKHATEVLWSNRPIDTQLAFGTGS